MQTSNFGTRSGVSEPSHRHKNVVNLCLLSPLIKPVLCLRFFCSLASEGKVKYYKAGPLSNQVGNDFELPIYWSCPSYHKELLTYKTYRKMILQKLRFSRVFPGKCSSFRRIWGSETPLRISQNKSRELFRVARLQNKVGIKEFFWVTNFLAPIFSKMFRSLFFFVSKRVWQSFHQIPHKTSLQKSRLVHWQVSVGAQGEELFS